MTEAIRMNPLPAPHPVLPAAAFPRIHAENFPHGDREAYAKYYPYGIPVTYKMIHGVHSQGVAQTYLEDNLPIGFYTNIPSKATAIISTSSGSRPFRKLDQILPQRRIHLWSKDEIQAICNSLRKLHWDELKNMQQPYCWDDLWTYFDAYDLYHNGCLNLWNIINTIWDENKLISIDFKREIAAHIGHWADEWLKLEKNREKLTQWKESQGSIYRILNDEDHESLGSLQDDVVPLIASALKGRRAYLLSNMEAEKAEEPADLITAFRTKGVENWLTGQPIFDGNGLPPPPISEPHRVSNDPAPCFEQDGKHYFLSPNFFPPSESFKKSTEDFQALHSPPEVVSSPAEIPKSGVVIVNGSNVPKLSQGPINKTYRKKIDELQSQNDTRRTSSMPEKSSPVISGDGQEFGRKRHQLAVDNKTSTSSDVRRSSESAVLSVTEQKLSDNPLYIKKEGSEAMLDNPMKDITEKKQADQYATNISQSNEYSGMAPRRGGRFQLEAEGHFPMHDTARFDQRQATSMAGSTVPKPLPSSQNDRRLSQEGRKPTDVLPGDSFKQSFTPSIQQIAETAAFNMQPEKGGMQHHVAPHGFPYQNHQFHSAQNQSIPHNVPYREFSGAPQAMPSHQLPIGTHSHAMPSTMPYSTPVNGSDDSIHPTQQPRQEYLYGSSMSSAHNGYQNSSRTYNNNRLGHRRGSQSQKTQGYVSGQQPQTEHHTAFQESHLNKSWRRGPPQDRARQSSWCRNPVGPNIEYCHCTCDQCNERNRSVWVRVNSPDSFVAISEILSFLRFGLSTRFGKVEEAYSTPSMRRDAFIVRFESESSVSQALAFGGGMVPEKDVRITIQPVHRSKWMKRHPQQQPRKLPPLPITHQQSSRGESLSPGKNPAHVEAPPSCSLASSHTLTPEPDQHEIPSRPTSASTLPQAFISKQSIDQQIISPTNETTWDESTELPAPAEMPAANRENFAFEGLSKYAAEPISLPLQAMCYPGEEKSEKKSVSHPESLSEETIIEQGIGCDIKTTDCDSSKGFSPKKVDIALPSIPINPTYSSSDTAKANFSNNFCSTTGTGSPMLKSNNRKVKQPSLVVMEDCQHRRFDVIEKIENGIQENENNDNATVPASSDQRKAQNRTKDIIERPLISAVASSEKHIESDINDHAQLSSVYTEKEIKERKQAWNRIPMPLDPRKSKKLGTAGTSGKQSNLPILNEPSCNMIDKADISTLHVRNLDQLESIPTLHSDKAKPKQLIKVAEVPVKDVTQYLAEDEPLVYEPSSDAFAQLPVVSLENELSTNTMAKGELQSSEMKTSGPYQNTSEQTDTTATQSQAPTGEDKVSNTENNQTKSKPKWTKSKKTKKRLALASQIVSQNEGSSQEISPSVSETSFIPKEDFRADYNMLMSAQAMSGSPSRPSHPVYFTGKPDERATEFFKDSTEQAKANTRGQYSHDTLPRGRHDFRNNAGGSLKVPKKRKNKYPAITSKTFEASATSRFESPQPVYAANGEMPMRSTENTNRLDSVTHRTEPDPSKRSRLNPLATAFESPQKATVAAVDTGKVPDFYKAASARIAEGEELLRENRSPSKFKIMQRPMATHNSPTKSQQPKEKFLRRIDSSKAGGSFEVLTKQQGNHSAERQRSWSKDKRRNESESKEPVNPKAISPGKKASLDKEDWPSLPASRIRSATLQ
ncbi:hypothetical protein GGI43DRAFT_433112 [Trichoderma evansii]